MNNFCDSPYFLLKDFVLELTKPSITTTNIPLYVNLIPEIRFNDIIYVGNVDYYNTSRPGDPLAKYPNFDEDVDTANIFENSNRINWNAFIGVNGFVGYHIDDLSLPGVVFRGQEKSLIVSGGSHIDLYAKTDDKFVVVRLKPLHEEPLEKTYFRMDKVEIKVLNYNGTSVNYDSEYTEGYEPILPNGYPSDTDGDDSYDGSRSYRYQTYDYTYTTEFATNTVLEPGTELYFRKDSYFHEWLRDGDKASKFYKDAFDEDFIARNYVNTDKMFIYFGKVYNSDTESDTIPRYQVVFSGLKDWIASALPPNNRKELFIEFLDTYFDMVYGEGYQQLKDVWSLRDAMECNETFLSYVPTFYGIERYDDIPTWFTDIYREYARDVVWLLKRKGTYASMYIIKDLFCRNTENKFDVYERWHDKDIQIDSEPYSGDYPITVQSDKWSVKSTENGITTVNSTQSTITFDIPTGQSSVVTLDRNFIDSRESFSLSTSMSLETVIPVTEYSVTGDPQIQPPTNIRFNCISGMLLWDASTTIGVTYTIEKSNNNFREFETVVEDITDTSWLIEKYAYGDTYVRILSKKVAANTTENNTISMLQGNPILYDYDDERLGIYLHGNVVYSYRPRSPVPQTINPINNNGEGYIYSTDYTATEIDVEINAGSVSVLPSNSYQVGEVLSLSGSSGGTGASIIVNSINSNTGEIVGYTLNKIGSKDYTANSPFLLNSSVSTGKGAVFRIDHVLTSLSYNGVPSQQGSDYGSGGNNINTSGGSGGGLTVNYQTNQHQGKVLRVSALSISNVVPYDSGNHIVKVYSDAAFTSWKGLKVLVSISTTNVWSPLSVVDSGSTNTYSNNETGYLNANEFGGSGSLLVKITTSTETDSNTTGTDGVVLTMKLFESAKSYDIRDVDGKSYDDYPMPAEGSNVVPWRSNVPIYYPYSTDLTIDNTNNSNMKINFRIVNQRAEIQYLVNTSNHKDTSYDTTHPTKYFLYPDHYIITGDIWDNPVPIVLVTDTVSTSTTTTTTNETVESVSLVSQPNQTQEFNPGTYIDTVSGGSGTGLRISYTIGSGPIINNVTVIDSGSGYNVNDSVYSSISGGPSPVYFRVDSLVSQVTSVTVASYGNIDDYRTGDTLTIAAGNNDATFSITNVTKGSVDSVSMTNPGATLKYDGTVTNHTWDLYYRRALDPAVSDNGGTPNSWTRGPSVTTSGYILSGSYDIEDRKTLSISNLSSGQYEYYIRYVGQSTVPLTGVSSYINRSVANEAFVTTFGWDKISHPAEQAIYNIVDKTIDEIVRTNESMSNASTVNFSLPTKKANAYYYNNNDDISPDKRVVFIYTESTLALVKYYNEIDKMWHDGASGGFVIGDRDTRVRHGNYVYVQGSTLGKSIHRYDLANDSWFTVATNLDMYQNSTLVVYNMNGEDYLYYLSNIFDSRINYIPLEGSIVEYSIDMNMDLSYKDCNVMFAKNNRMIITGGNSSPILNVPSNIYKININPSDDNVGETQIVGEDDLPNALIPRTYFTWSRGVDETLSVKAIGGTFDPTGNSLGYNPYIISFDADAGTGTFQSSGVEFNTCPVWTSTSTSSILGFFISATNYKGVPVDIIKATLEVSTPTISNTGGGIWNVEFTSDATIDGAPRTFRQEIQYNPQSSPIETITPSVIYDSLRSNIKISFNGDDTPDIDTFVRGDIGNKWSLRYSANNPSFGRILFKVNGLHVDYGYFGDYTILNSINDFVDYEYTGFYNHNAPVRYYPRNAVEEYPNERFNVYNNGAVFSVKLDDPNNRIYFKLKTFDTNIGSSVDVVFEYEVYQSSFGSVRSVSLTGDDLDIVNGRIIETFDFDNAEERTWSSNGGLMRITVYGDGESEAEYYHGFTDLTEKVLVRVKVISVESVGTGDVRMSIGDRWSVDDDNVVLKNTDIQDEYFFSTNILSDFTKDYTVESIIADLGYPDWVTGYPDGYISSTNERLSTMYRARLGLNHQPLSALKIMPKQIADNLYRNWEMTRPVNRQAIYEFFYEPSTDLLSKYYSIYTGEYAGQSLSKVIDNVKFDDDNYIHIQGDVSSSWRVKHNLDSEVIVHAMDENQIEIVPESIVWVSSNVININFSESIQGIAVVTKAKSCAYLNSTYRMFHGFGRNEVFVQIRNNTTNEIDTPSTINTVTKNFVYIPEMDEGESYAYLSRKGFAQTTVDFVDTKPSSTFVGIVPGVYSVTVNGSSGTGMQIDITYSGGKIVSTVIVNEGIGWVEGEEVVVNYDDLVGSGATSGSVTYKVTLVNTHEGLPVDASIWTFPYGCREGGSCSIGDHGTRGECESSGGVWTSNGEWYWDIYHGYSENLFMVDCYDSSNEKIVPLNVDMSPLDENTNPYIIVTFSEDISGFAAIWHVGNLNSFAGLIPRSPDGSLLPLEWRITISDGSKIISSFKENSEYESRYRYSKIPVEFWDGDLNNKNFVYGDTDFQEEDEFWYYYTFTVTDEALSLLNVSEYDILDIELINTDIPRIDKQQVAVSRVSGIYKPSGVNFVCRFKVWRNPYGFDSALQDHLDINLLDNNEGFLYI